MEDRNNDYNSNATRNSRSLDTRDTRTGWIIAGVVALAAIVGISFYNSDARNNLQDISPAAGSSSQDTTTMPQERLDNR